MSSIPHQLHQIWIGSPPPAWVSRFWDTWDAALADTDWTTVRHTDETLPDSLRAVWRNADRLGLGVRGTADLLRLRILQEHGGVYADSDTMPLVTGPDLTRHLEGDQLWFGTWQGKAPAVIENGVIGAPAHDPGLARVLAYASDALRRGVTRDHDVAGPAACARALRGDQVQQRMITEHVAGEHATAVRRGDLPDADAARAQHQHAAILHVLCNYGEWEGRR